MDTAKPVVRDVYADVQIPVEGVDLWELVNRACSALEQLTGAPLPEGALPRLDVHRDLLHTRDGVPVWKGTATATVRRPVECLTDPDRAVSVAEAAFDRGVLPPP